MKRLAKLMLLYGLLVMAMALTLLPLFWMLMASLMPTGLANAFPPRLLPYPITFEHYQVLFTRLDLVRYLFNSTLLVIAVTIIVLFLNSIAGYLFAKLFFFARVGMFR